MKKNLRYIIAFLLALMMLLSLCACAQTGTAGNSGELDLDYVGEDTDQPEEEKPWYHHTSNERNNSNRDACSEHHRQLHVGIPVYRVVRRHRLYVG